MATGTANTNTNCSVKCKQYAADPAARNLVADSPDTKSCARMVKILAAGSFTSVKGSTDNALGTLGPLQAGETIPCSISELISADAAFIAFW